ncbi:MerR family transcriptional regulator [Mycobacterium dioxanotrophicus]|uniref:MerR family transcriptional regulator n=1 Tax=Mycobacterium dioxanotrophicus TaxID=482462 RepID=A0A1Y0C8T8_9MYCO|nr:helix-turn-helix transcriptional regulator [Mycobacterium dioxanotrophicus]ART71639.1 MerR family transcriptional regulator [Mycobacterium dioxanotrophicus]
MTGEQKASRSARGVYGISVAAELSGIGPQTLRLYERSGLLSPARTAGGTRRYSDDDIEQLRRITELVEQGVNLAGIMQILDLQDKNSQLESDNNKLEERNAALEAEQPSEPQQDAAARQRRSRGPGRHPGTSKHPAQ